MPDILTIRVYGTPAPGGSKNGFRSGPACRVCGKRRGPIIMQDAGGDANAVWKATVAAYARQAMAAQGWKKNEAPVCHDADCTFFIARPKSHFGTGKNAAVLKPNAPVDHLVAPDSTKFWRPTEDALTHAGVWQDDSQCPGAHHVKQYCTLGQAPGCEIKIIRQGG
jgi:hypothetical protein